MQRLANSVKSWRVFLIWFGLVLVSCTFQSRPPSMGERRTTLRWAVGTPTETLDWTLCASRQCLNQSALIMEGLTSLTNSDQQVRAVPNLAREWSSPSPTEFIFKLKHNISWSNGRPLRARQFIQAWEKLLSPHSHAAFAPLLFSIANAKAFNEGKIGFSEVGVFALDDETLILRLDAPDALLPLKLSHPATWPIGETTPGTPSPVLGPFFLERATPGVSWRYVRNSSYHGSPASLGAIEIRYVEKATTRIDLFMSGETDLVDELPESILPSIEQIPGFFSETSNRLIAAVYNTSKRIFSTIEQRQGFSKNISVDEVARLVGRHDTPVSHLFPGTEIVSGWTPDLSPSVAKNLLAPFVVIDASTGKSKTSTFNHSNGRLTLSWNRNAIPNGVAENIQAQLQKNLDLKFDLAPLGSPLRDDSTEPDNSALTLVSLSLSPLAPVGPFEIFASNNPRNPARWKNKMFDVMLAQAQQSSNLPDWSEKLKEADELIVAREVVVMPLVIRSRNGLRLPQIRNLSQNPIEIWDFRDTTM